MIAKPVIQHITGVFYKHDAAGAGSIMFSGCPSLLVTKLSHDTWMEYSLT